MKRITQTQLDARIRQHEKWLVGKRGGKRLRLYRFDLRGLGVIDADLSMAYFDNCDLRSASFSGSILKEARIWHSNARNAQFDCVKAPDIEFTECNLVRASFCGAHMMGAGFDESNLYGAYLDKVDLRGADLEAVCSLKYARLEKSDLRGAKLPSPTEMLLVNWGRVSDSLTRQLMQYDAANHPDPKRFDTWAEGADYINPCPYNHIKVGRAANFSEKASLWVPNSRARVRSAYELMVSLIKEKCRDSDFHKSKFQEKDNE